MPARRSVSVAALAALTLAATACSNRESPTNKRPHNGASTASLVGGIQQVTITTGTDLRFHPSTITVHPGKVRIRLVNNPPSTGGPPHNLQVTGLPAAYIPDAAAGQTRTVTFTAPAPGRYNFVCTIHATQGQTGVLIVKPGAATS
ncbi:MAG: blue (type 1) copper domain protein [Jatrophihabitans sp.]|nr:blue (type 1) copper domain protein [Jatrophihabitans sp.]